MMAQRPHLLGITGGSGSGKTTLARQVVQRLGEQAAAIIQLDSYYLNKNQLSYDDRRSINYDHPSAFDWNLLKTHLFSLRQGEPVEKPIYNFHTHARLEDTIRVDPKPVLILEGILLFEDAAVREMLDTKVYVDTDADVRFIRRMERDVRERGRSLESIVQQYMSTVRPMHLQFVEPSKRYADLIVPEGGSNRVALDAIVAQVRSAISTNGYPPPPAS